MSWNAPRTWVTSEAITSALMNGSIRVNFNETLAGKAQAAGDFFIAAGLNAFTRLSIPADINSHLVSDGEGISWKNPRTFTWYLNNDLQVLTATLFSFNVPAGSVWNMISSFRLIGGASGDNVIYWGDNSIWDGYGMQGFRTEANGANQGGEYTWTGQYFLRIAEAYGEETFAHVEGHFYTDNGGLVEFVWGQSYNTQKILRKGSWAVLQRIA